MAVEMTWNTGNVINVQTLDYQYLFIYYLTSSFHQERKDEKSVHFILSCKRRLKQTSDKSVLRVNFRGLVETQEQLVETRKNRNLNNLEADSF